MSAKDSVVVITGGSSGIGLAVAKQFVLSGAKGVVITGRNKERIEKAARELTESVSTQSGTSAITPRVLGIPCDATSWEDNVSLMKATNDAFGRIDYVFANATGEGNEQQRLVGDLFSKPNFYNTHTMIDSVNYTIHAAVPYLASSTSSPLETPNEKPEGGPGRDRAIILTSSEAAFAGLAIGPEYSSAKGALNALTFSNKGRLGALGIRINCLAPSWIDTPLAQPFVALGVLQSSDFIPMQVVTDAMMRFVNNATLSGVVTRIPTPHHVPFDVVPQSLVKNSYEFWEPFLEKMDNIDWQGKGDKQAN